MNSVSIESIRKDASPSVEEVAELNLIRVIIKFLIYFSSPVI